MGMRKIGRLLSVKSISLATIIFLAGINLGFYCSEPSEPYRSVPSQPFCGSYSECDDYEKNSYRQEISDHIEEINVYLEEAVEYAKCILNEAENFVEEKGEEAREAWDSFVDG